MKEVMIIVEAIEESDLFKGVSKDFLHEIGKAGEVKHCKPDSFIFHANEKARYVYQLIEGTVEIMMADKEIIHLSVTRPDEIIGWSALVEPYTYTATAISRHNTKVVRISREAIEKVIMKYPADGLAVLRHLTAIISHRLRHAYLYIYNKG
jgi:CRP-like cAMP-binding protein